MTTVYRGYARASAMLGTLPMFYLILPKSHSSWPLKQGQLGRGGKPALGSNTFYPASLGKLRG